MKLIDPSDKAAMAKRERSRLRWSASRDIAIALFFALLVGGGLVAYNAWAYGDWACAFKRCVHVENVKP